MNMAYISSVQDKIVSPGRKWAQAAKERKFEQGDESRIVDNLLDSLEDTLPYEINLEAVVKLMDYQVFTEAKNYLKAALLCTEDSSLLAQIYYLLARCAYQQESLQEAVDYLDKALQHRPNSIEYWNLQADCYLELGNWQAAVAVLNKSVRSSPRDAELIFRLGSIFLYYGEFTEALNCFSGCCQLKPYNPDYWEMKAEMLIKLGRIRDAGECFQKAIKYGGPYQLYSRLAYCYAMTGELRKAKNILLKVLKKDPDNYDALVNLGGICHKIGNNEQAYKLLRKALNLNSNDPLLYNNLGLVSYKLGRSRKAIDYYKEALQLNASDPIVLYNLASCLAEKGLWEEAKSYLEKLLGIDPNHSAAWVLLGNIYEQLDRPKKAIDCFNHSLGLA